MHVRWQRDNRVAGLSRDLVALSDVRGNEQGVESAAAMFERRVDTAVSCRLLTEC